MSGVFTKDSNLFRVNLDYIEHEVSGKKLSSQERLGFEQYKIERGQAYFQDLIYTLFQIDFSHRNCETIWKDLIQHKEEMTKTLRRKVHIIVAGLDYFSKESPELEDIILLDKKTHNRILQHTVKDSLTGLYNFAYFKSTLPKEIERFQRFQTPTTLIMMDLDNFKNYNDSHGHLKGNELLAEIGDCLKRLTREYDSAIRYGGDEFAIIAPNTNLNQGLSLSKRLVELFKKDIHTKHNIGISIGVASASEELNNPEKILQTADQKLYVAKKERNFKIVS